MHAIVFTLAFLSIVAEDDARDVVKLKSGSEIKCRVLFEGDDKVIARVGSHERTVPVSDVASVSSVARSMDEWIERAAAIADDDVASHLGLSEFCTERKLPHEADLEALHVLRVDPKNEKAHRILKHRRGQGTWFAEVDGGEIAWGVIDRATEDWGKALQIRTEHWTIRTNAGVRAAVDLGRDLEAFYSIFHQLFGKELELRQVLDPMPVFAYRSKKDSTSRDLHAGNERDRKSRIRHVIYDEIPGRPRDLFHEATHALTYTSFELEQSGSIPAWIDEGLAKYFEVALTGPPGRPTFQPAALDPARFKLLAGNPKAAKLTRVLNYNRSDFVSPTDQALKYAEVYTFVHFLLHADGEAYRKKFLTLVREAFQSKASANRLEKLLGRDLDVVEKVWKKYVAEKAGTADGAGGGK